MDTTTSLGVLSKLARVLNGTKWFHNNDMIQIQEVVSRFYQSGSEEEQVECAVCLCKIEEGEEICSKLRCDHAFHKHCLDRWLGYRRSTCPLCRGTVIAKRMVESISEQEEEELFFSFSRLRCSHDRCNWWLR